MAGLVGTPSVSPNRNNNKKIQEKIQESRSRYFELVAELESSGRKPTRRERRRLAYDGQMIGMSLEAVTAKILALDPDDVSSDLPTPGPISAIKHHAVAHAPISGLVPVT